MSFNDLLFLFMKMCISYAVVAYQILVSLVAHKLTLNSCEQPGESYDTIKQVKRTPVKFANNIIVSRQTFHRYSFFFLSFFCFLPFCSIFFVCFIFVFVFLKLKIFILIHVRLCGPVSDKEIFIQPISGNKATFIFGLSYLVFIKTFFGQATALSTSQQILSTKLFELV